MSESRSALNRFIQSHGLRPEPTWDCRFIASVTYRAPVGTVIAPTWVRIRRSGGADGDVHLEEAALLSADSHHMAFSTDLHAYRYDNGSGELCIRGLSRKLGGPYTVTIAPLPECP